MTQVIGYFAGPGAGKSTVAAMVFSILKMNNVSAELITEYAKDIVWEGQLDRLKNQMDILSEQFKRQWRVNGKVDYIITDSPILLQSLYVHLGRPHFTDPFIDTLSNLCEESFNQFKNINFFIHRAKPYHASGRNQTEEEARELDYQILERLRNGFPHIETNTGTAVYDTIDYLNHTDKLDLQLTFSPIGLEEEFQRRRK